MGVDLLPAIGWRRVAVGEVNAFGDLLPRLTGLPGSGAEGRDTYAAQVTAALRRHSSTSAPGSPDPQDTDDPNRPNDPHGKHHPRHPHDTRTGSAHAIA